MEGLRPSGIRANGKVHPDVLLVNKLNRTAALFGQKAWRFCCRCYIFSLESVAVFRVDMSGIACDFKVCSLMPLPGFLSHGPPSAKKVVKITVPLTTNWQLKVRFVFYSHLKNLIEIVTHITAIAAITIIGVKTLSIGKPSEVACSSLMPCVNGIKSATL